MSIDTAVRRAAISLDENGCPFSPEFGDIYASKQGAFEQACHVFLGGNNLPERWQGQENFVILENGFGLGTNFLATLKAWRSDPNHSSKLHFVSIEKYPLSSEQLITFADPHLISEARELAERWPAPVPGVHELSFNDGQIVLTLYFMDVRMASKRLLLEFDALYLDGFAPSKNSGMWEPSILTALCKQAKKNATLSTWCVAGFVRRALENNGFEIVKKPGFGKKSQMTTGVYRPKFTHQRSKDFEYSSSPKDKTMMVIGAGLSGSAVASAFCRRGWKVTVIDEGAIAATGASAIRYGIAHSQPSSDDNQLFRITRRGLDLLHEQSLKYSKLFELNGLPQFPRDKQEEKLWEYWFSTKQPFEFPSKLLYLTKANEFSHVFGLNDQRSILFHPSSGLVAVSRFVQQRLYDSGAELIFNRKVSKLENDNDKWAAYGNRGELIASASVCVICAGNRSNALLNQHLPIRNWTGRLSLLTDEDLPNFVGAITGPGYVIRTKDDWIGVGATYEPEGSETDEYSAHEKNLNKLKQLLPNEQNVLVSGCYKGVRCSTPDRLPLVGKVPSLYQPEKLSALGEIKREKALYISSGMGSRGLVFSDLAARIIAADICGEPSPIEKDLLLAMDPGRFIYKTLRC